tara:strand:+ start:31 stop:528 length:498 start_codon:yes stop_codon:yes gene_type:complete
LTLDIRLSAFAESLSGPLGHVPFDRAVRADLDLFRGLRESGATWPQIANALTAAGARRPDGSIISSDHVRSAVTRQLKRLQARETQRARPIPSSRQTFPSESSVQTAADRRVTPDYKPNGPAGIRSGSERNKTRSSTEPTTAPISDQRNKSILEKLARTRKLRES